MIRNLYLIILIFITCNFNIFPIVLFVLIIEFLKRLYSNRIMYKKKYINIKLLLIVISAVILLVNCKNRYESDPRIIKLDYNSRPTYITNSKILFSGRFKNSQVLFVYDKESKRLDTVLDNTEYNLFSPIYLKKKDSIICSGCRNSKESKNGEIFIIKNKKVLQVTNSGHANENPFFSPKDDRIYFERTLLPFRQNSAGKKGYDIYSIKNDGSDEKMETNDDFYYIYYPQFFNDGDNIFFAIVNKQEESIYKKIGVKYNIYTKKFIQITKPRQVFSPVLANNNKFIYYYDTNVGISKIDVGEQKKEENIIKDIGICYTLSMSDDDSKILIYVDASEYKIAEIYIKSKTVDYITFDQKNVNELYDKLK
jgi:hypothetical protein